MSEFLRSCEKLEAEFGHPAAQKLRQVTSIKKLLHFFKSGCPSTNLFLDHNFSFNRSVVNKLNISITHHSRK